MWKPWRWGRLSQEEALANARTASTELSRLRVEREAVELYLTERHAVRAVAPQPA